MHILTSISANADGSLDPASRKIDHIALQADQFKTSLHPCVYTIIIMQKCNGLACPSGCVSVWV